MNHAIRFLSIFLGAVGIAHAVPTAINYQGRLTDGDGNPASGSKLFSLSLYDAATAGNELYTEIIGSIAVDDNGIYNFQFGVNGSSTVAMTETLALTDSSSTSYTASLSTTPLAGTLSVTAGTYSWNPVDGNPGEQATATVQLINGFLIGVTVTNGGEGYTSPPVVTIVGNGTGATATAVVDGGVVTAINVNIGGNGVGYTTATVGIAAPPAPFVVDYAAGELTFTYDPAPAGGTNIVASYDALEGSLMGAWQEADAHWIELSVDGDTQSPRERVLSVPFAQVAATVESSAIPDVLSKYTGGAILSYGVSSELEGRGFLRAVVDEISVEPTVSSLLSSTGVPSGRYSHSAVWTGSEMIIWGGYRGSYLGDGRRYDPTTDIWSTTAISTTSDPSNRYGHTAVWTGSEMIIWGGFNGGYLGDGRRYDPATDVWSTTAISATNAPSSRRWASAVWTGSEMIIWGGTNGGYLSDGRRYDPATDTWTTISTTNAPTGRYGHTAVWTGSEMIIWGGFNGSYLSDGHRYDPATDSWTAISTTNAPTARRGHTAVWAGSEMIIWGGFNASVYYSGESIYSAIENTWVKFDGEGDSLSGRYYQSAVWTGSEMIIWGGTNQFSTYLNDGARYDVGYPGTLYLYVDPSALKFRP